ncbi:MAG: hypothetical protein ABEH83_01895 [Halobacterium sp.]
MTWQWEPAEVSRGAAPAVGKALEAGIVVLFVALLTSTLYGGVVPDARTAAGGEVGERTLQHAAASVEAAVPATAQSGLAGNGTLVERRVSLPETIRGGTYRITAVDGDLVLVHDNRRVGGRTPLVLPDSVRAVRGNWTDGDVVVRVTGHPDGGLVVELAEGSP